MKYIVFFLFLSSFLFACSGDCRSCHSSLDYKDSKHTIMLNCKTCHTDEKLARVQMQNSCGQDCFVCHSVKKINSIQNLEHLALNECINCHSSLKNTLREKLNNTKPLFDFLNSDKK